MNMEGFRRDSHICAYICIVNVSDFFRTLYISQNIGQRFIEPQTADLSLVYKDSSPTSPLIFILSVGTCV